MNYPLAQFKFHILLHANNICTLLERLKCISNKPVYMGKKTYLDKNSQCCYILVKIYYDFPLDKYAYIYISALFCLFNFSHEQLRTLKGSVSE